MSKIVFDISNDSYNITYDKLDKLLEVMSPLIMKIDPEGNFYIIATNQQILNIELVLHNELKRLSEPYVSKKILDDHDNLYITIELFPYGKITFINPIDLVSLVNKINE